MPATLSPGIRNDRGPAFVVEFDNDDARAVLHTFISNDVPDSAFVGIAADGRTDDLDASFLFYADADGLRTIADAFHRLAAAIDNREGR